MEIKDGDDIRSFLLDDHICLSKEQLEYQEETDSYNLIIFDLREDYSHGQFCMLLGDVDSYECHVVWKKTSGEWIEFDDLLVPCLMLETNESGMQWREFDGVLWMDLDSEEFPLMSMVCNDGESQKSVCEAEIATSEMEAIRKGKGAKKGDEDGGKYARYTQQQLDVLETAYTQCPNPNHLRRAQILREQSVLRGIDTKQLKIWFQNRRCRERQRKENDDLMSENRRLMAANKMLREENDSLQKKLTHLMMENENLRNQILGLNSAPTGMTEANSLPMTATIADDTSGLRALAEEAREEFLSKAMGTAVVWTPNFGMKLRSLASVATLFVSSAEGAVAARGCVTVPVDPLKVIEILKDKCSWCCCCRAMNVNALYSLSDGATIELLYTQYYSPTIVACARDFWTLRYTSVLSDGSFVVCEKSISSFDGVPGSAELIRGKMLASGFLVRPVEGGTTIHLIHHLQLEALSVPEVVRPLYESSGLVAKNMVVAAFHYFQHMIDGRSDKRMAANSRHDPSFLRLFSQRLCRGFDDAVNCFPEDGWVPMNAGEIVLYIKQQTRNIAAAGGVYARFDSVICANTSLVLQNVDPVSMVKALKERRSAWMDFNFSDHTLAFSKAACFAYPGPNLRHFAETSALLGHADCENEAFEVIRFGHTSDRLNSTFPGDLYHLQIINGMEDIGAGSCAELIFAPIDRSTPKDAVLLSSGFRIFALAPAASLVVLAFQFPFESHLQEEVAAMAQKYVEHVVMSLKKLTGESEWKANSANPGVAVAGQIAAAAADQTANLANIMYQSYSRSTFGVEMMIPYRGGACNSALEIIEQQQHAILCFSFSDIFSRECVPSCLYANRAAMHMVGTCAVAPDNLPALLGVGVGVNGSSSSSLFSILQTVMQQGYAILPRTSGNGSAGCVSYGQAVLWVVQETSPCLLALAFMEWSLDQ
ncbi:homeobox-leucine zipper protein REVOLUTA-like [Andrographis paniculata]|uniref:homeobox-leucine zipper protein REVOLUTA-like n=1 Tax=Andrographis paniculata TaxID=175694 RepID=UPI0021E7CA12|nr:homeobox-leucine zipper protein REVOLUTA-like [Andrographis paniculata]